MQAYFVFCSLLYFDKRSEERRWWARLGDETSSRDFISRSVEIRGASNRGARSLTTRWKMSLRERTDDDDRFCRRSLLLFLIFLWWPYVPLLYHFLSLVILVLHISSLSLLFFRSSASSRFLAPSCKPPPGRCSRNSLQGGIEKKYDLVSRQTKGIRESKFRRSRNDYLAILAQNNIRENFVLRVFLYHVSSLIYYLQTMEGKLPLFRRNKEW